MSLTRLLDAPADKLFRCWTTPELIKQWFAPKPYTTPVAEVELRVGGRNHIVMKSPEGQDIPCPGTYLEIVLDRRIVFTDAFTGDWIPREGAPFMVATVTFEPKAKRPATPRRCATGARKTAPNTSKWAFTKAGASAPISSKRLPRRSEGERT